MDTGGLLTHKKQKERRFIYRQYYMRGGCQDTVDTRHASEK